MISPRRSFAAGTAAALLLTLVGLAPAEAAAPVAGAQTSGDSLFTNVGNGGYDVMHYDIDLDYSHDTKAIEATTTIDATAPAPLSSFSLDFEGLTIESLTVDGEEADYERVVDADAIKYKLVITPQTPVSDEFTTVVTYSGVPTTHIDPDGSSEGWVPTADGATFVNEPVGAMTLFPNNNSLKDKATFDISLTVPTTIGGEPAAAASNGELVDRDVDGDTTTWHWKQSEQMATYLTLVSIGNFTVHENAIDLGDRTITEYSFIDSTLEGTTLTDTEATRAKLGPMLNYLEDKLGRYPGASTGIVVDDVRVGYALETQDRSFFDGSADDSTLLHELTHQWFGDAVSATDWSDLWLAEGPATLMEAQYAFDVGDSQDPPAKVLYDQWDTTATGDDQFTTPMAGFTDPAVLFGPQTYYRGAESLQALRTVIGDDDFDTLLSTWIQTRNGSDGSTADWIALAGEVSGVDLTAFYQDWAYDTDKPAWPAVPGSTPGVTGTRRVGATLTAVTGAWAPAAVLTYQWLADGTAIPGATGPTYVPTPGDVGRRIAVTVTGTQLGYAPTTRTSPAIGAILRGTQVRHPRPRISGPARVGRVLRVRPGAWDAGTTLTYRWYVDGHRVRGGTDGTFRVPRSARGDRIRVRVTSTKAGYGTRTELSDRTSRVR
ncbi:MAG: M1 family aminopeptidase [Aeromicrobium sp.]